MNDLQIEAFLAVLQYKSYSKAAQAIYVPQPTLSHRILQLEQELGASLLIRNAKEISLTEAGQHFLPYAHQLYRATENARQEMQSLRRGDGGTLTVGVSTTLMQLAMAAFLKDFITAHPEVNLRVLSRSSEAILRHLSEGQVDVAVVQYHIHSGELTFEEALQNDVCLVASPSHPLAQQADVHLSALAQHSVILFPRERLYRAFLDNEFTRMGVRLNHVMEAENIYLIKTLVAAGLGLSLLPRLYVAQELKRGTLCEIQLREPLHLLRKTYIGYRQQCKAAAKLFLKELRPFLDGISAQML